MLYLPPATSRLPMMKALRCFIEQTDLEGELCDDLGARSAYCSRSWVGGLALFLDELQKEIAKREVILPRYSCYEFTQAIQMAGATPVYVDIEPNGKISLSGVASALTDHTLAIIAVTPAGIVSDLSGIAAFANQQNLCFIEDATYTLLGQYQGRRAGTWGDVAVLNFSEGKAMPIGGGVMVLNHERYQSVFERCRDRVRKSPHSSFSESFIALLIHRIGSSLWGYSIHHAIKNSLGINLKERMSMEQLRRTEGRIPKEPLKLSPDLIGPIHPVKQRAAIEILRSAGARRTRQDIMKKYKTVIAENPRLTRLPIADEAYILRLPILCSTIHEAAFNRHLHLGMSRLYGPDSPLNVAGSQEPHSLYFYNHLVTLPTHEAVNEDHICKIAFALKEITA